MWLWASGWALWGCGSGGEKGSDASAETGSSEGDLGETSPAGPNGSETGEADPPTDSARGIETGLAGDTGGEVTDTAGSGGTTAPPLPCAGQVVGAELGQCGTNFSAFDAEGRTHQLHDLLGSVVLLDLSAMWCSTCQRVAPDGQALYAAEAARGLVLVTVLFQDEDFNPDLTPADLTAWASAFDLTHPVWGDSEEQIWDLYGQGGRPSFVVFDRELTIQYLGSGASGAEDAAEVARSLL